MAVFHDIGIPQPTTGIILFHLISATGGGFDAATARELAAGVTITITANGTELVKSTAVNCPCPSPSAIRYMYKQLDLEREYALV